MHSKWASSPVVPCCYVTLEMVIQKICNDFVKDTDSVDVGLNQHKWSKGEGVDYREWEHRVNESIERKIRLLKEKHTNRCRQHVLRAGRHLDCLHNVYVLVPADKAANNSIVMC